MWSKLCVVFRHPCIARRCGARCRMLHGNLVASVLRTHVVKIQPSLKNACFLRYGFFSCAFTLVALLFSGAFFLVTAQKGTQKSKAGATAPTAPLLTRNATRHETRRLGYGGTGTLIG